LVVGVLLLAAPARADKAAEIDAFVGSFAEDGLFSGSILVVEGGRPIFKKGYGLASREWAIANGTDTRMRVASITKQFTAVLVLRQVQAGKLKLDGKVSDYLPWYRKDTGSQVTLHHLLSNSSGIPEGPMTPALRAARRQAWPVTRDYIVTWCSGDLGFPPGSKFEYSNAGFAVLAAILEEVTGKSYAQLLREHITEPFGMKDTGVERSDAILPRMASGYAIARRATFMDMSFFFGSADLYSTAEDLARWDAALYSDKLLQPKYRALLSQPNLHDYAYGFVVTRSPGRLSVSHDGGISGFSSRIVRYIEQKNAVIVLSNDEGAAIRPIANGVVGILYGEKPPVRQPSIARPLRQTLAQRGALAAVEQYRALAKSSPTAWNFAETELNRLGYELLQRGQIDDALLFFKLNVEVFPDSWNVHDSLGEAYAVKGDRLAAVKSYAHSLELNPDNANAIRALVELR